LVVELDGEVHCTDEAIQNDKQRTKYLETLKVRVIRFENQEVMYQVDKVLKQISINFNR